MEIVREFQIRAVRVVIQDIPLESLQQFSVWRALWGIGIVMKEEDGTTHHVRPLALDGFT